MANIRRCPEMCYEGEHIPLSELKKDWDVNNRYLRKTSIPPYPGSVLFRMSRVCHVTGESGLRGIVRDGGFRNDDLLWCSAYVSKSDITSAERRFYRWSFEDDYYNQRPFLEKFTTSPAFQSESRYGNFRFIFHLRNLLRLYSRQFCRFSAPVLRVLRTELYRQEILYSVLVHPPHVRDYDHYPRLPYGTDAVCAYREGCLFWLCQSPSDWYRYRLVVDYSDCLMSARQLRGGEYYVWDQVATAFHMEPGWILRIDREELLDSVSVCDMTRPYLLKDPLTRDKAEEILEELRGRNCQGQQKYY